MGRMPVLKYLLPSFDVVDTSSRNQGIETPPLSDPVSATRVLCGALFFPSMAVLMGKLLFQPVHSNLQKSLLGGLFFPGIERSLENLLQTADNYTTVQA